MNKSVKIIEAVAKVVGGKVRNDYSGRGMFGATCYGVDCKNPDRTVEEAASRGLRAAKVDAMGKGFIVYWPAVRVVKPRPIDELIEAGAVHQRAEDSEGVTKDGWWMDNVWLGPYSDPASCLLALRG